jgi:UDP-2,3-diacylglucosamine pyrophosphatase LpxH
LSAISSTVANWLTVRPVYNQILRRLLQLAEQGTLLRYAPGNHDDFLRHFLLDFGFIEIQDEFIHQAIDGRRLLVLHGDRFDDVELQARWLSVCGAFAYDGLMWVNGLVNCCRGWFGQKPWPFSASVKKWVKQGVTFVSNFERRLAEHALQSQCQGVICGHVHTPAERVTDGVTYFNTGDWVENCTALAEYTDGSWELIHLPIDPGETCAVDVFPAETWLETQDSTVADELSLADDRRDPVPAVA